jgi:acetolactate synthase-1/2/3 large subunit
MTTSAPARQNLIPRWQTHTWDQRSTRCHHRQVSSELLGRDVFQEADITGAGEPSPSTVI